MLLDALQDRSMLRRFIPFDVDAGILQTACAAIVAEYPGVDVDSGGPSVECYPSSIAV